MHEFAIVQSLVDVAVEEARRAGAQRVLRLECRIGDLRGVESDLLREAFELLTRGTMCEQADLLIERTSVRARCPSCQLDFDVRDWNWYCPACGKEGRILGGGDELELRSIEAEVTE
jgi:hydrogenase nickel incorporation protein HypA/HybF